MTISPQEIKKPASVDLGGEYTEVDREVITRLLVDEFKAAYERSKLDFAYFCDFSTHRPYSDPTKVNIQVSALDSEISLFSGFILPGFVGTSLGALPASGEVGIIESFIPFVHAEYNGSRSGIAFTATLKVMNGSTLIYEFPVATSNDSGVFEDTILAGDIVGLINGDSNTTYTYTLTCKQIYGPLGQIKSFGLMYNGEIYALSDYTPAPDPLLNNTLAERPNLSFGNFTWC